MAALGGQRKRCAKCNWGKCLHNATKGGDRGCTGIEQVGHRKQEAHCMRGCGWCFTPGGDLVIKA